MPLSSATTISEDDYARQSYVIGRDTRNPVDLTISYNQGDKYNPNQLTIEWTGTQSPSADAVEGLVTRTLENLGTINTDERSFVIETGHSNGHSYIIINDSNPSRFPEPLTLAELRAQTLDALAQNVGQYVPNEAISRTFRDANIRLSGVYSYTDLASAMEIPRHNASDPRVIIGTNADGQTVVRVDIAGASGDNLPAKMLAAEKIIGHLQAEHSGTNNLEEVRAHIVSSMDSLTPAYDVVNRAGNPSITLPDGVKPGDVLHSLSRAGSVKIGDLTHHYQPVITPEGANHAAPQLAAHLGAPDTETPRISRPKSPQGGGIVMGLATGVTVAGSVLYTGGNVAQAAEAATLTAAESIPGVGGFIAAQEGRENEAFVRNMVDGITTVATVAGAWVGGTVGGVAGTAVPVAGNVAGAAGGAAAGGMIANVAVDFLADEIMRTGARLAGYEDVDPSMGEQVVVATHGYLVDKATDGLETLANLGSEAKENIENIGSQLSQVCVFNCDTKYAEAQNTPTEGLKRPRVER